MSHLQPKFLAKAKASLKKAQAPRAMPRSMIETVATSSSSATKPVRGSMEHGWFWMTFPPDYRIFSLKK